ncbi:MAG: radical SAM protein [Candidatus Aminicenantes bacterium]|nr:radical SAM protein [Candidatus Aminicenantes bacterium]
MPGCNKETRFTCNWIFNILVVLCDGKVVCGCADPFGERPLGHLSGNGIYEIWNSEKIKQIRRELNKGHSCFCDNCGLKRFLREDEPVPQGPEHVEALPRIFFEPTVLCNLACFKAVCHRDSGILNTRTRKNFPLAEFKSLLDQVGKNLNRLDFFNYGDPFVHPQAAEMIAYVKEKFPHIYLYTSTNGLMLDDVMSDDEKIKKIVHSGLDEITFSVDGVNQETYARYRQGGDFKKALEIMAKFAAERNKLGREVPFINWRYILFKWNDAKSHLKRARKLAEKIGVDRFTWEITDHPEEAKSEKYQVGTKYWKKIFYEVWDTNQVGNAIKSKRFIAKIKVLADDIGMNGGGETVNETVNIRVKIKNTGGALWRKSTWSGRRYVRLGVQLYDKNKNLLDANYSRAFLNRDLAHKEKDVLTIALPPIKEPGDYFLKFDMVLEFRDWCAWFESGGSPAVWVRVFK